jgi:hypothetical protein
MCLDQQFLILQVHAKSKFCLHITFVAISSINPQLMNKDPESFLFFSTILICNVNNCKCHHFFNASDKINILGRTAIYYLLYWDIVFSRMFI